ncbi:MAG: hypothetical protein ABJN84_08550 [Flavobacteriaceae bacterium]|uniref:hypothetical protein n=1 Tax=Nonlabens ulvanivorans TaxID=906888 RepID=UPI0032872FEB
MEKITELSIDEVIAINGGSPHINAGKAYKGFFEAMWEGIGEGIDAVVGAHYRTYHN